MPRTKIESLKSTLLWLTKWSWNLFSGVCTVLFMGEILFSNEFHALKEYIGLSEESLRYEIISKRSSSGKCIIEYPKFFGASDDDSESADSLNKLVIKAMHYPFREKLVGNYQTKDWTDLIEDLEGLGLKKGSVKVNSIIPNYQYQQNRLRGYVGLIVDGSDSEQGNSQILYYCGFDRKHRKEVQLNELFNSEDSFREIVKAQLNKRFGNWQDKFTDPGFVLPLPNVLIEKDSLKLNYYGRPWQGPPYQFSIPANKVCTIVSSSNLLDFWEKNCTTNQ